MDMFDQARAMNGAMELCKITQKELGERMGFSQSYIANKLRLLSFSDEMIELIRQSGISERHARALLRLENDEQRRETIEKIRRMKLTVRESEALIDSEHPMKLPRLTGGEDRLRAITAFKSSLKDSLEVLRSFGIDAKMVVSYHRDKEYITIEASVS